MLLQAQPTGTIVAQNLSAPTFSTASAKSRHAAARNRLPLCPQQATFAGRCPQMVHELMAMNSSIFVNEAGLGFRVPSSHSLKDSSSTDTSFAASSCVTPSRRRAASNRPPNVFASHWGSQPRNFITRGQSWITGSFLPFSHPINVL